MLENLDLMDEQLREKLKAFEMPPPDAAWLEIKKSIPPHTNTGKWLHIIVGLMFISLAGLYLVDGSDQLRTKQSEQLFASLDETPDGVERGNASEKQPTALTQNSEDRGYSDEESKYRNLSNAGGSAVERAARDMKWTKANADSSSKKPKRQLSAPNKPKMTPLALDEGGLNEELSPNAVAEAERPSNVHTTVLLQPKEITSFYYINAADPRKDPFAYNQRYLPSLKQFQRFSIDAGMGVSTFRIRPMTKDVPGLAAALDQSSSKEIEFGGHVGLNYHVNQRISVSAGVEIIAQRNNYVGKVVETQTQQQVDTIGFDTDSIYNTQDSMWYVDTTWNIATTDYETFTTTNASGVSRSTLFMIPFAFSFKQVIGTRSSLEVGFGGSIGVFQQMNGKVVLNSAGELVSNEIANRKQGHLLFNASVKYLYQLSPKQALYAEPRIGVGLNNFYQSTFSYQSRISQLGIKLGYRLYL